MAIGSSTDLRTTDVLNQIFHQEAFDAGRQEIIDQNINAFNEASNGAITRVVRSVKGDYEKKNFVQLPSSPFSRRDLTSLASITPNPLPIGLHASVKINRKNDYADTLDKWKKMGETPEEFSLNLGRWYQSGKQKDMLNTALIAIETALESTAALNLDITGETTKTLTHSALNRTLAKLGDMSGDIVAWVMYSKPAHDLVGQAMSDNVTNVADAAIIRGSTFGLGRPIIMVDAPALTDANASLTDTYNVLGLKRGAVEVVEAEQETVWLREVYDLEQLALRFRSENAYTIGLMGYRWDIANGGANPTDGTLGTTTNWDAAASVDKLKAGVRLVCQ